MEVIRGTAMGIRTSLTVSGGSGDSAVRTINICIFDLDGKRVELSLHSPIHLDENDSVALAGSMKKGVFKAFAYRNYTRGIIGKPPSAVFVAMGLAFACLPTLCILATFDHSMEYSNSNFILGFVSLFFCIGVFIAVKGIMMIQAVKKLESSF